MKKYGNRIEHFNFQMQNIFFPFIVSAASETVHKSSGIPITPGRDSMPSFSSAVCLQFASSAIIEQIVLRRRRSPTQL